MTAIIFDLDGTLIDSVGDIHVAVNQMLAQAGYDPLEIETVTSFVGKGSSNLVKRVISHVGLSDDAASHAHYCQNFWIFTPRHQPNSQLCLTMSMRC